MNGTDPAALDSRRGWPSWWYLVVLGGFLVSFGTWGLASPLASVPDEPAHVVRAAAVWHGQLGGETVDLPPDPNVPELELQATEVRVPLYYARLGEIPGCHAGRVNVPASCSPTIETDGTLVDTVTTAGIYTPAFYALVGWPSRLFASSAGVYAMRATSILVSAVMLTLAVACLKRILDPNVALIAVWVAATPMVHYLAGSVNPNGVEVAAAIAAWAAALAVCSAAVRGRLDRFALVAFVLSAALMVPTRTLGPLFCAGIVLAALVFSGPRALGFLVRERWVWIGAAAVAAVALASVAWTVVIDPVGNTSGTLLPENESLFLGLVAAVDDWARQMVAIFGWLDTGPVTIPVVLWGGVTVMLLVLGSLGGRRWRVGGLAALVGATLFVPVAIQSQVAGEHGINWQGRYLLPVAVGVPMVALLAAGDSRLLERLSLRRVGWIVLVGCGVALVTAHVVVMQRFGIGLGPGAARNWLTESTWDPPLPMAVLFGLAIVGAFWPAWLMWDRLGPGPGSAQELPADADP